MSSKTQNPQIIFDESFCKTNRFYDNSYKLRKQNDLYSITEGLQQELVAKLVIERNLNSNNVFELEIYQNLQILRDCKKDKDCFDIIKSNFFLHKLEKIDEVLLNVKKSLKHGGIFYGTFFGISNINELSNLTFNLQSELCKNIYPMSLPCIETKTLGMMLQNLGFKDISVMNFCKKIEFNSVKQAINFTRIIGGTNCLHERQRAILPKQFAIGLLKNISFVLTFDVNIFIVSV